MSFPGIIARSLSWRLIFPVGLVIIVAVSLHIFLLSSQEDLFNRKMKESERVGRLVQSIMLYDMQREHFHDFQTYLDILPFGDDLASIRLYDHEGYLRYAVDDQAIGRQVDRYTNPVCSGCHISGEKPVRRRNIRLTENGQYVFQVDFPLANSAECLDCHKTHIPYVGNLLTELTFSKVEMRVLNRRRLMIYVGSAVMAAALIITWLVIHQQVVNPIRSLVGVIQESGKGNVTQRIDTSRKDEIGYLIRSYNNMMDTLSDYQNQLSAQVDERTRELESSRLQLLLRENLASLGRLAAGVAHELGNPLTGISSIVQLVKRRKKDDPFIVEQLDLVKAEIDRLARLSRQMVDLARPDEVQRKVFDIQASIHKAYQIAHLDRKMKKRRVMLPDDKAPVYVLANEDAILQIMMNLLFNAADFTGENGRIEVRVSQSDMKVAEIEIEDDGTGIPEDMQDRVFDPFFSQKKAGEGTGLGLSVSHSLARSFQGDLILKKSDSQGTVFLLRVPLAKERSNAV